MNNNKIYFHFGWFTIGWWQMLLNKENLFTEWNYRFNDRWYNKYKIIFEVIKRIYCRAKGHEDMIWFNASGYEPNYHCRGCHDDLG